jgi:hypothetical protein
VLAAAGCQPAHGLHSRVQALVVDVFEDAIHIASRAAAHRVPLRSMADLKQAVVVAEADHRAHGKVKHLLHGAGPDAGHHRQEVAFSKCAPETMALQKLANGLGQRRVVTAFGQHSAQAVEAQQVGQHVPKAR